ncbi:MAG: molybdopterin converting factor subunit 1 [Candidatus Bathyarchaeia archaeon]
MTWRLSRSSERAGRGRPSLRPSGRQWLGGSRTGGSRTRVRLRFFASIREMVGTAGEELDVPDGLSVEALLGNVKMSHEFLRNMNRILIALNGEYVDSSTLLKEGDVVALFPPVSGG